jgi:hypothetical protein
VAGRIPKPFLNSTEELEISACRGSQQKKEVQGVMAVMVPVVMLSLHTQYLVIIFISILYTKREFQCK